MKIIGTHICTLLLTAALIFTFVPWTRAVNEARAATKTIQSVNIDCDIPAIELKEGKTELQVYTSVNDNSSCTTPGVHALGTYTFSFWDEPWDRFTSVTSRDSFVVPSLQYYISPMLVAGDGYDWPGNVKKATSWTKASSLSGFKVTLNNVDRSDAVVKYVESGGNKWLDVNIPIGNDISKSTVVVYPAAGDYSGSPMGPSWVEVKLPDGTELDEARYTMTYINASGQKVDKLIVPGVYRLKITANGIYSGTAWGTFTIRPMCIVDGGTAKLTKTEYTYNGKEKTPGAVVTRNGRTLVAGTDYIISYKNNKNAGTATAFITGTGLYGDGWEYNFVIKKAANPLKIAPKTATVRYSALKKKTQTLKVSKVIRFTKKGQGAMQYKRVKVTRASKTGTRSSAAKKYINIASKSGKVTVKKGLKKGTYKVTVRVKAGGNSNYNASAWKTVTFKVRVK